MDELRLEEARHKVERPTDDRPRLEEPLPVWIEAVADVHLPSPRAPAEALEAMYVKMLEFAKLPGEDHPAFRADNFKLFFDLPRRELSQEDYRPLRIIVRRLAELVAKLAEAEIEYTRQKGLTPGEEALVLKDPDGNWLEIREHRETL